MDHPRCPFETDPAPRSRRMPLAVGLLVVLLAAPALAQDALLRDVNTAGALGHAYPRTFTDLGTGLFVFEAREFGGTYLYATDGTLAGTFGTVNIINGSPLDLLASKLTQNNNRTVHDARF